MSLLWSETVMFHPDVSRALEKAQAVLGFAQSKEQLEDALSLFNSISELFYSDAGPILLKHLQEKQATTGKMAADLCHLSKVTALKYLDKAVELNLASMDLFGLDHYATVLQGNNAAPRYLVKAQVYLHWSNTQLNYAAVEQYYIAVTDSSSSMDKKAAALQHAQTMNSLRSVSYSCPDCKKQLNKNAYDKKRGIILCSQCQKFIVPIITQADPSAATVVDATGSTWHNPNKKKRYSRS